jgi:hypothetical protein
MNATPSSDAPLAVAPAKRPWTLAGLVLIVPGLAAFLAGAAGPHPERAWQAFLINFLLWSAMAQGAVLFSAVTEVTRARWSAPLKGLAEAFAGFFPVSLVLFPVLLLGREHLFPWLHQDLHGKEAWLNLPFLFTRDGLGLFALSACGFAYLAKRRRLSGRRAAGEAEEPAAGRRARIWAGLYCFAFALVLCLIGFDLVMSMDPHWYSTLFGAYHFVKAFYVGLGALIILAAVVHLRRGRAGAFAPETFHDVGKLFFAFGLLWADFFYVQLMVIWYGNIPEETHYVILRTVLPPWRSLAWTVFILAFIVPFLVLLNKRVKTRPKVMLALSGLVIVALWMEHLLLIGPALTPEAAGWPLGATEVLVFVGFLGLMVTAVTYRLRTHPELLPPARPEVLP